MNWSRPELIIAVLTVAVGIVGAVAQILTVPNQRLRRFLLLVLVITIAAAVRLVIVGGSPHTSEPASLPLAGNPNQPSPSPEPSKQAVPLEPASLPPAGSPNQPSPSPEPSKQAVPLKAESGQSPSPPVFWPSPPSGVSSKAVKPAESIQNAIVGDWASDDLLAADIHFTEGGEFKTMSLEPAPNLTVAMKLETGTYKFIGDSRIEIRIPHLIFPDEVAEWDLTISGDELRVSVVSGFGRGAIYHRKS